VSHPLKGIRPRALWSRGLIPSGPLSHRKGGESIGPRLARGLGYLAEDSAQGVDAFLASVATRGEPHLWITDRRDVEARDGGVVLRVTTLRGPPGTLDPKHVQELRGAVAAFLDEHGPGTSVIVDCVEVLALHNGVERVVRALEDLHEEVAMRDATLVVFLSSRGTNPRLAAWLEREFERLPAGAAAAAERLLA